MKGNTGCVTDMSFLYTPEYFQQVFHMNRKAHSSTNKFLFFLYIYNGGITERRLALLWSVRLGSPAFAVKSTLILLIIL